MLGVLVLKGIRGRKLFNSGLNSIVVTADVNSVVAAAAVAAVTTPLAPDIAPSPPSVSSSGCCWY